MAKSSKRSFNPRSTWNITRLRYAEKEFAKHALLVGQVALAWNHFHEILLTLFSAFVPPRRVAAAVWSSSVSDRAKREMLKAALKVIEGQHSSELPRLADDVLWLLGRADSLEDLRNDIVHAPLEQASVLNWSAKPNEDEVVDVIWPSLMGSNRRAAKLREKDLLAEYRYCRDAIAELSAFVLSLQTCLHNSTFPWPNRPAMPAKRSPRKQRQKRAPKRLPPILKAMLERSKNEPPR